MVRQVLATQISNSGDKLAIYGYDRTSIWLINEADTLQSVLNADQWSWI